MKYRNLGSLEWKPSALGLGCMRLPTVGSSVDSDVSEKEAIEMIRFAIDNGVNYVDSAYYYHSEQSEPALGKALKDGYRDKVKIATKSPLRALKKAEEYEQCLETQLKRLGTEIIDFYLFHNINRNTWKFLKDNDLIGRAEAAQKAGKIGHICFSFHDNYSVFEEVVNAYDKWFFAQVQYNFIDDDFQAGAKGVKLAASKGMSVVVMEPLKGGKIANPIPDVVRLLKERGYEGRLTDLALKWLWRQPEVSVVLSGMTDKNQVRENIKSAGEPYELTEDEIKLLADVKALYKSRIEIPCSNCAYCLPCPQGIGIPTMLNLYNEAKAYDGIQESKRVYKIFGSADKCTACNECRSKCPQGIPISEWMPKIHETLV